jgi:hypothetical protein
VCVLEDVRGISMSQNSMGLAQLVENRKILLLVVLRLIRFIALLFFLLSINDCIVIIPSIYSNKNLYINFKYNIVLFNME